MSVEHERLLRDALRNLQSKHAYFLLAAAGACIGFALTRTQGLAISWWQIPVLLALLCWGASFYFGCRQVMRVRDGLSGEADWRGNRAGFADLEEREIATVEERMEEWLESCAEDAANFALYQFRLLIGGACLYVAWQIIDMSLRASAGTSS